MEWFTPQNRRLGALLRLYPSWTLRIRCLVWSLAVCALDCNFLALLGWALPGWMPCRAVAAQWLIGALDLHVPWFLALVAQFAPTLSTQDRGVVDLAFPDRASLDRLVGVFWMQEFDHHGGLTLALPWTNRRGDTLKGGISNR